MNTAKKFISALLVTAAVGTSVVSAQSITGDTTDFKRPLPEDRQKIISLIEAGDYAGWKALMTQEGHTKAVEKITADQFAKMSEMAVALKNKDWAKVKELRKELPPMPGVGKHPILMKKMAKMKHMIKHGEEMDALANLPQSVRDQLKTAFANHDKAAIEKILKDNGITPPAHLEKHEQEDGHDQDIEDGSNSAEQSK